MAWNPDQYEKFRGERAAPFEDLVALAPWRPGLGIVDLGCGTGELTAKLRAFSPGSEIVGLDSSAAMLERARPLERPGLRFALGKVEEWQPEKPLDVIFSHAALQWIDDHATLFPRLARALAPGGVLLVQMPSNHNHVSHRVVRELASSEAWRGRLGGFARSSPVLAIDEYASLLHEAGLPRPTLIEKVYGHVLEDARGVLEWIKGTLLVPYLERLSPGDGAEFLEAVGRRLDEVCPGKPYFYPFRRTLIAAWRPSDSRKT
jgi:trans-aconitate 2-methyltransferase